MTTPSKHVLIAGAAAACALALAACSGGSNAQSAATEAADEAASAAASAATTSDVSGEVTVFAAKSLTKAFDEIIATVVPEMYPDLKVNPPSYDGSNTLVEQIAQGAPADVLATADQKNMTAADEQGLVGAQTMFASNTLVLVTPADNPGNVTGFDESLAGKDLAVCAVGVPCGNASETLAKNLGKEDILAGAKTQEQNVGDVLSKVENGQADAGLVYKTDATSAGDKVKTIQIEGAEKVINDYPIAPVKASANQEQAKAFIDVITSEKGQAVLEKYGFAKPSAN